MLNTFTLALLPQFFIIYFFWIVRFLLFIPPPHLQLFIVRPLSFTPITHLLSWCEAPPTCTLPAPTTRQPPPLVPAPRAACLCLPPFPMPVCFPLFRPQPAPRSLSSPGGFTHRGSLRVPVLLPRPPWVLFWILALSGTWCSLGGFSRNGKRPRGLHSLSVALPGPCYPCYLAIPAPFRLPPPPPPLFVMIPSLSVEEVWGVALEFGISHDVSSHGRGCSACKTESRYTTFWFDWSC